MSKKTSTEGKILDAAYRLFLGKGIVIPLWMI